MIRRSICALFVCCALLQPAFAAPVAGTVRIWGNAQLSELVQRWQRGLEKLQPGVRIESHLTGSDIGMAGLYTGLADVALLGREPTDSEIKAYEWVYGYRPLQLQILTGSRNYPDRSPALAVLVHHDNPLAQLDGKQLAAIINGNSDASIRSWNQLGLHGEWDGREIHVYLDDTESGTGRFFRHAVLDDSRLLDWQRVTEFHDQSGSSGTALSARQQILAALEHDRYGIAVTSAPAKSATLKLLQLSCTGAAAYCLPDEQNLIAGRYPLGRMVYAVVSRAPDRQLAPAVSEFLRYVLSPVGQRQLRRTDGYLPLSPQTLRRQRDALR